MYGPRSAVSERRPKLEDFGSVLAGRRPAAIFPSFSRETASETFSAMKIGRSEAFEDGGLVPGDFSFFYACLPVNSRNCF
jgi:hypothetical protein